MTRFLVFPIATTTDNVGIEPYVCSVKSVKAESVARRLLPLDVGPLISPDPQIDDFLGGKYNKDISSEEPGPLPYDTSKGQRRGPAKDTVDFGFGFVMISILVTASTSIKECRDEWEMWYPFPLSTTHRRGGPAASLFTDMLALSRRFEPFSSSDDQIHVRKVPGLW